MGLLGGLSLPLCPPPTPLSRVRIWTSQPARRDTVSPLRILISTKAELDLPLSFSLLISLLFFSLSFLDVSLPSGLISSAAPPWPTTPCGISLAAAESGVHCDLFSCPVPGRKVELLSWHFHGYQRRARLRFLLSRSQANPPPRLPSLFVLPLLPLVCRPPLDVPPLQKYFPPSSAAFSNGSCAS